MAAIIPIRQASASPTAAELVALLAESLRALAEEVAVFRQAPPTPARTCAFEKKAALLLREAGRTLLDHE
jgi:hypothetical protein